MGLFLKEYLFYDVILPKLETERNEKGLEKLALPKCFYAHPDPGVLVMNNLKDDEFEMLKDKPSNLRKLRQDDNIILFIKCLASLHASTYSALQKNSPFWLFPL